MSRVLGLFAAKESEQTIALEGRKGIEPASALLAASVFGCTGEGRPSLDASEFPPGSCVIVEGNPTTDDYAAMDPASCENFHTHVVIGMAATGTCSAETTLAWPSLKNDGQDYCLREASPAPSS